MPTALPTGSAGSRLQLARPGGVLFERDRRATREQHAVIEGSAVQGWYFAQPGTPVGQEAGPFSWEQMVSSARAGTLTPSHLVCNPAQREWFPAGQVSGLFADTAQAAAASSASTPPLSPAIAAQRSVPHQISWWKGGRLLLWLLPVIALVLAGAGYGLYFGLGWGGGELAALGLNSEPVLITADDGATVTIPAYGSEGDVDATLARAKLSSGEVSDDSVVVSDEYVLRLAETGRVSGDLIVALPLRSESLPEGWSPVGLTPESFDQMSGLWMPVGTVVGYEEAKQQVLFNVPFAASESKYGQSASLLDSLRRNSLRVTAASVNLSYHAKKETTAARGESVREQRYRIRYQVVDVLGVSVPVLPEWPIYSAEGSKFEIMYKAIAGTLDSVPTDQQWPYRNQWTVNAEIPDYVEDLHHALEVGYSGLLAIKADGRSLFQPLQGKQSVLVTDIGQVQGQASALKTIKVSSNQRAPRVIDDYEDLEQTATHFFSIMLMSGAPIQSTNSHLIMDRPHKWNCQTAGHNITQCPSRKYNRPRAWPHLTDGCPRVRAHRRANNTGNNKGRQTPYDMPVERHTQQRPGGYRQQQRN